MNGCKLPDAILLPALLPQTNANRLCHRQNLKIINLRDQASHDSGNVPFKKTPKNCADYASRAIFIKYAKSVLGFPNYASIIDKGLL